jgi:RNA polymerase primary sigma factor
MRPSSREENAEAAQRNAELLNAWTRSILSIPTSARVVDMWNEKVGRNEGGFRIPKAYGAVDFKTIFPTLKAAIELSGTRTAPKRPSSPRRRASAPVGQLDLFLAPCSASVSLPGAERDRVAPDPSDSEASLSDVLGLILFGSDRLNEVHAFLEDRAGELRRVEAEYAALVAGDRILSDSAERRVKVAGRQGDLFVAANPKLRDVIDRLLRLRSEIGMPLTALEAALGEAERHRDAFLAARKLLLDRNLLLFGKMTRNYLAGMRLDPSRAQELFPEAFAVVCADVLPRLDHYDPEEGALSTYLKRQVSVALRNHFNSQRRIIYVDEKTTKHAASYQAMAAAYEEAGLQLPADEDIAKKLGITWDRYVAMRHAMRDAISLDAKLGDDEDGATVADVVACDAPSPEDEVADAQFAPALRACLDRLPSRLRRVLTRLHGLSCTPWTIDEVAEAEGEMEDGSRLTKSKVSRLRKLAIERLRADPEFRGLGMAFGILKEEEFEEAIMAEPTLIDATDPVVVALGAAFELGARAPDEGVAAGWTADLDEDTLSWLAGEGPLWNAGVASLAFARQTIRRRLPQAVRLAA